jgi:hypothetical protein
MSPREFWAAVKREEEGIDGQYLHVMSLHIPARGCHGGVVSEVDRHNAAKLITSETHRRATPEEIQEYAAAMDTRKAEIAAQHQRATIDRLGFIPAPMMPTPEGGKTKK